MELHKLREVAAYCSTHEKVCDKSADEAGGLNKEAERYLNHAADSLNEAMNHIKNALKHLESCIHTTST